jgi:hypothetical protein
MPPLEPELPDEPEPLLPLVPLPDVPPPEVPPAVPLEELGALGVTAAPLLLELGLPALELELLPELEAVISEPHSLNP